MKQLIYAAFMILAAGLVAAGAEDKPMEIGRDSNGKKITLSPGSTFVVRLSGNPTTGYNWYLRKMEGDSVARVGKAPEDGVLDYTPDKPANANISGAGGTFSATFRAEKPGATTLAMDYKRPWEKDVAPVETFTLSVEVAAATGK